MNSGSLESVKPSTRCGCKPKARQMRLTMVWLNPEQRLAIARVRCVASAGVLSKVSRTTRFNLRVTHFARRLGRASSSNLLSRRSTNR